jgi:uncharacterized protein YfaS (alpha-2-macroglobulin family)
MRLNRRGVGFVFVIVSLGTLMGVRARATSAASVESFTPLHTVKDVRQVTARFSEAMVPFGDPKEALAPFGVECGEGTPKGEGRWADPRIWVYDFVKDLPAGAVCTFTLKAGVKTLAGTELGGTREFKFDTGGPAIREIDPYEGSRVEERQAFLLSLDAPVDPASVLEHAHFEIDGLRDPIGVQILEGKDRKAVIDSLPRWRRPRAGRAMVLLQARQAFPAEAKITLVWGAGIRSRSGVLTGEEQRHRYEARKPFTATLSCERVNAQSPCIPVSPVFLQFSESVSWEQVKKIHLSYAGGKKIHPELPKGNYREDSTYSVSFGKIYPEATQFKVEVPAGLVDGSGRTLANADHFPLEFSTDRFPPLAKFPGKFGIIELKPEAVLPVTLRNVEATVKGHEKDVGTLEGGRLRLAADHPERILKWLARVDEEKREISLFDATMKPEAISVAKPNGADAFEVVGLPFKAPGFYLVELQSPRLGQALLGAPRPMYVSTAALVTNLAVHFEWGKGKSVAWVTTLDAAQPVDGATVRVNDCKGALLWSGKSDTNGIARIENLPDRYHADHCKGESAYANGVLVSAQLGDDLSFTHSSWTRGIEPWRFHLPHAWAAETKLAHTIFDRTLLRAGETVHMKHFLRLTAPVGFKPADDDERPTIAVIEHQGSEQKFELPLRWNENGSAVTDWSIPKEAKLGTYSVRLRRSSDSYGRASGEFRVEEFRVPLLHAQLQPPSKPLVRVSEFPLELGVRYLAGGGAGGLAVKVRHEVKKSPGLMRPAFAELEDFQLLEGGIREGRHRTGEADEGYGGGASEMDGDESGGDDGVVSAAPAARKKDILATGRAQDLTLDANGTARAKIESLPESDVPIDVLSELEFRDPSGEVQTASATVTVWPSSRVIGLRPDGWTATRDNLKFRAVAVDLAGKPIAGAKVIVDAFEKKTFSHRKRLVGGFYAYESFEETNRLKTVCEGETDSHGLLFCAGPAPAQGNLTLVATTKDDAGHAAVTHADVWVAGEDDWWFTEKDDDRMDLLPEKKRYEPGETARLQARMPFREATALVSIERDGVIDARVVHISGKEPVVEVPIDGGYAPNVYVSVLAVRGRVGEPQPTALVDLGRPAYKLGLAELEVGWRDNELKVAVTPEHPTYRVRERAHVHLAVKGGDGKPASGGEVAVAAVDEGLLELMPNTSWKLLEAMMQPRGYGVESSTAQMQVVGKRHFGLKALPHGGGGGKRVTRELFDTLLYWNPRVALDSNGEADVEIPIGDSITGFKIAAVATAGDSRFGTGEGELRTTQDLMTFSGISPVAREGDRFRPAFTLRNATDHAMEVTASLTAAGHPLESQSLALAGGESREAFWDFTAPVGASQLSYELLATEKGGASDRLKITQAVVPATPERTVQATISRLEKPWTVPVARPEGALPGRGGIRVDLQARLSDGLEGVVDYMRSYPYACLEQKVSKSISLRSQSMWDDNMERLPAYLDSDGLAKYYPTDRLSGDEVLTAYVLSIADESGFEIPAYSEQKMIHGLTLFVEGRILRWNPLELTDLSVRKLLVLAALARKGAAKAEMLTSIPIEPNLWPTSAVLDWITILKKVADVPDRDQKLSEAWTIVRSRLNFQGTTMSFSNEQGDELYWLMESGDGNALKLLLLALDDPAWKEDMPRLVRGAVGRQHQGHWLTSTSNAWGIVALEHFSKAFESTPVTGTTTASLGAATEEYAWKKPEGTLSLPWPARPGDAVVEHRGAGIPWATIRSVAAIPLSSPISTGYHIEKSYEPVDVKTPGKWSRGDVIRVKLKLSAQAERTWVVVDDPIPAGATILGSGLGRDSAILSGGEKRGGDAFAAFEERGFEGIRQYYEWVPKGDWSFEYTIRLNQGGKFQLPATHVEAMYSPEMFGELPNPDVTIAW